MTKCSCCKGTGQEADYVGLEMKPVAVDCEICGGSGEREDELTRRIQFNAIQHQRAHERETQAWRDELIEIINRKPPAPILVPVVPR